MRQDVDLELALDFPPGLIVGLGVALDKAPGDDLDGLQRGPDSFLLGLAGVLSESDLSEDTLTLSAGLGQRQNRSITDREVDLPAIDAGEQPVALLAAWMNN